ncbi:MAG: restriction endonuclease subunit S [Desulfatitalea sp.]|nr:restriction endonuclease subunit S [Desulfatitalea sp.]NNK00845.1 restriction endonuclease subunit S [Desulfatitalea sp.]
MTADLRPYPEYKESGLPWLGRIPAHWEIGRNGRLFEQRNQNGFSDLPILEVSLRTGVRVRDMDNLRRKQVMSDREKYKRAVKGDIAYNMMRMWQGAVGVAPVDGLVSPAYVVARPYSATEPRYFAYLFRTNAYMNEVDGYSRGIVKDRNRLYWQDFKRMPSCIPPYEEQKAIANYLDANAIKIRRFIRNRRRLIEVLNEQKQAIINRAVTRGLNPTVLLKPSSIDWLGDFPEHWRLMRIKRVARINPSRAEAYHLRESIDVVVFLPMERVSTEGEVDSSELRPINEVWQGFTYFRRGDVVVAKITPCFENGKGACLSELDTELGFGTTEFIVLRPTKLISTEFLYQLTKLKQFRLMGVESMTGAAGQQRVSPDFVANFTVPVPPVEEQTEIIKFISSETAKFSIAIDRAQREIDLIREYQTRLIADVVTGKLDVQHLSPGIVEGVAEFADFNEDMDIEDQQVDEELEALSDMDDSEGE